MVEVAFADRDALDRLAIRELLERYADAVSRGNADAWEATWAEDGEWEIADHVHYGREAIVSYWRMRMAEFAWVLFRVSVGTIEVCGDAASARSYTSEIFGRDGNKRREVFGCYEDELRREDGSWRFRRRRFAPVC